MIDCRSACICIIDDDRETTQAFENYAASWGMTLIAIHDVTFLDRLG